MSIATFYTHSPGRMSDGSKFRASAMTCASRVYPLHSRLKIATAGGRHVIVTVTDRTARGRTNVDCTPAAFRRLCPRRDWRAVGVLHVHIHRLGGER